MKLIDRSYFGTTPPRYLRGTTRAGRLRSEPPRPPPVPTGGSPASPRGPAVKAPGSRRSPGTGTGGSSRPRSSRHHRGKFSGGGLGRGPRYRERARTVGPRSAEHPRGGGRRRDPKPGKLPPVAAEGGARAGGAPIAVRGGGSEIPVLSLRAGVPGRFGDAPGGTGGGDTGRDGRAEPPPPPLSPFLPAGVSVSSA